MTAGRDTGTPRLGENEMMLHTKIWAEAGEWTRGEPALVIMRGVTEDGQLVDSPEVLHDVPVAAWPDNLAPSAGDVARELKALGYRKVPESREEYTPYGVAFDVEELAGREAAILIGSPAADTH